MCLLEIQQSQRIPHGKRRWIQSFSSIEGNASGSKVDHIPHCEAFCLYIVLIFFVLFSFWDKLILSSQCSLGWSGHTPCLSPPVARHVLPNPSLAPYLLNPPLLPSLFPSMVMGIDSKASLWERMFYSWGWSAHSKKCKKGAGEVTQRLKALAALWEVLSSIPSNYMVAHNHL